MTAAPPPAARPGATDARLVAVDAGVTVDGRWLLTGVDVALQAGEVLVVVGPNGAGKSTLLGVLSGDRRPDTGTVALDDRPLDAWRAAPLARRRAVLPQRSTVSFGFTAGEVVAMGRAPWAVDGDPDRDRAVVAASAERTGVTHLLARPFPTLSGGEQARVALARVLAQDTDVLLLDEPTAALDLRHQELVMAVARDRATAGAAVVVVLHDLGLAAAHADRVLLLQDGRVRAVGAPTQVLTAEVLSEVYEHPVEVLIHPRDGSLVILPTRQGVG